MNLCLARGVRTDFESSNVEITGRDLRETKIRARHRRPIGYRRAASSEPRNKPFGMPSANFLSG
jgi:hypothetical protein